MNTSMLRTDSLKRDTYFKHIVSGEDEASIYIRNLIIESILGITFNHLYAINPEMVPDYDKEKDMILDILFVADTGEYIQMEMQDSKLTEKQLKRFQIKWQSSCRQSIKKRG